MNLSETACNIIVVTLALVILLAAVAYYFINRLLQKVKEAHEKLLAQATIDDLTQLYNRRSFFRRFHQEFERAKRYQRPLSCLILDIDNFKEVNDTFGHLAGDQVLQEIAHILKTQCRQSDLAGRYGGEEMIVLLPETEDAGALAIAERIREMIADHETIDGKGQPIRVTVSIGVTYVAGTELANLDSPDRIVQYADDALLAAKKTGRNRTILQRPS
jgi:diguanylate cyclase (GGDEF)-like protein